MSLSLPVPSCLAFSLFTDLLHQFPNTNQYNNLVHLKANIKLLDTNGHDRVWAFIEISLSKTIQRNIYLLILTQLIVRLMTPEKATKTTVFSAGVQSIRYSGFRWGMV